MDNKIVRWQNESPSGEIEVSNYSISQLESFLDWPISSLGSLARPRSHKVAPVPSRVKSERDLGRLEVEMSKLFLRYARDIQTGVVVPSSVDSGIVREVPYRNRTSLLKAFAKSSPKAFIKKLPPQNPEYSHARRPIAGCDRIARGTRRA